VGQLAGGDGGLGIVGGGGAGLRRSSRDDNCAREESETGMERTLVR
jgi:hypothetical protein